MEKIRTAQGGEKLNRKVRKENTRKVAQRFHDTITRRQKEAQRKENILVHLRAFES